MIERLHHVGIESEDADFNCTLDDTERFILFLLFFNGKKISSTAMQLHLI